MCYKPLATKQQKTKKDFYYFAKDALVCWRHPRKHYRRLCDAYSALLEEHKIQAPFEGDAEKARKLLVKAHAQVKSDKEKTDRKKHDYQLKLMKRADAARGKR